MTLKATKAPALDWDQINRLRVFCQIARFSRDSTTFDMGYAQAQRDLMELIDSMVTDPNQADNPNFEAQFLSREESRMRRSQLRATR